MSVGTSIFAPDGAAGVRAATGEVPEPRHTLCLVHPMDPRGEKVGGIETHVRLMLEHAPADWQVLFVGVDGRGDCELGKVRRMTFKGREFDFLPVLSFPEDQVHKAASRIHQSITFRFLAGLLRHLFALRRAIRSPSASFELQRFEFAIVPALLRRPALQMIHGEGSPKDKMDSLIKKFWFVHRANEEIATRLANRIVCVNPNVLKRLAGLNPRAAQRATFMPVPVDTGTFALAPFDTSDRVLRVVFAGRLDEFKDPPTMFRVLARAHELLGGACEFHYVGTTDPHRYPEFRLIETFTVRHGFLTAPQVASVMARCHMGMLTSFFEGMPCYLLEVLSVGRPVAAIRLPQYDLVIEPGVSGAMIERQDDEVATVEQLAEAVVSLWRGILAGDIEPAAVRARAEPYSVDRLLVEHFARHASLDRSAPPTSNPGRSSGAEPKARPS